MTESGGIPADILDDLSSRFIINIPEEERTDPIRLFFQIELAHWFYLDFHRKENPSLKSCGLKGFSKSILNHIPRCAFLLPNLEAHYNSWREYKMSVPTYGAIVLNEDMTKVLLVQSYFERTSWGFPKGKVNEDEDPVKCAAREVLEETGFDVSSLINPDAYFESFLMEQRVRLYIVCGVKETVQFQPQTRNEIKSIEWFNINDLPNNKKEAIPKLKTGIKPGSLFMVLPFVKRIKAWVQEKKDEGSGVKKRQRHKSTGDTPLYSPVFPLFPGLSQIAVMESKVFGRNESPMTKRQNDPVNYSEPRSKNKSKDSKTGVAPKPIIKRQLFGNKTQDFTYVIPQWLNFKLNKEELLKCFDL